MIFTPKARILTSFCNVILIVIAASVALTLPVTALAMASQTSAPRTSSGGLNEGLLVEAQLTQGASVISGRVLIEAGRTDWTTIAASESGKTKKSEAGRLKLEARANLIDSDVVEIETRVTGKTEQTGKLVVRLGETGTITTSQMEGTDPGVAGQTTSGDTSIGVKVLRVRYSL